MKTKDWHYVYAYIQDFSPAQVQEFVDLTKGHKVKTGQVWVFIPGEYNHMLKNAQKAVKYWQEQHG